MTVLLPLISSYYDDVLQIWNAALPDFPMTERLLAYNVCACSGETVAGRLAVFNGEPLGFVLACAVTGSALGWVSAIAVHPAAQGRGVGAQLLAWAENWLKEKECKRVRLGGNLRPFAPGLPVSAFSAEGFFTRRGYVAPADQPYEYDIARDLASYAPLYSPPAQAGLTAMQAGEEALLLTFLEREYPGRWEFEAREFIKNGGRPSDFLLLRVNHQVEGFCRLTLEDSERPLARFYPQRLPRPWGQFGPLGLSKAVRGQGLGGYLIDAAAKHLHDLGVRGCVIDWTSLTDLYAKFGFSIYNRYRSLFKPI
jgi:GNAT superfamily N-acetyltransferase